MYTILDNYKDELIIKNSKFIALLYKVNNINEVMKYLKLVKDEYKDATHYCYGYIIDDIKKSSDDGEPSGTAGMPILEVLNKRNLNQILVIVVRYFGGIKLGAGGLIRAYSKVVLNSLDNINLVSLINGKNITIKFNYDMIKQIDYLLKDEIIITKNFDELIIYNFNTSDNELINKLENDGKIELIINKNIYIEKKK